MSFDINFDLQEALVNDLETKIDIDEYEGKFNVIHYMRMPGYGYWRTFGYHQDNPESKLIGYMSYGSNSDFRRLFKQWLKENKIDYEEL